MSAASVLPIASLRRDGGTQPRDHLSPEVAKEYAQEIADGAAFPPVIAFYDGTDYWLADGFHRVEAYLRLHGAGLIGAAEIPVDVRQGTLRDAVLLSVGANASHGYRRSILDKRRAVLVLLNDPEWRDWSDREIARRCNVSRMLVAELRPPLGTVSSDSDVRTFIDRHGNPSHMRVENIGRKKPALPVIAGRQAERKPDLSFAKSDEAMVGMATRITGLSQRHITEMARKGEIDGAVKEGGQWVMPTASLVALVEEAQAPEPEPELEPPIYDHEVGQILLSFSDTIGRIAAWPSVDEVLGHWSRSIGAAPSNEAIAEAASWMADFAARWPVIAAERSARIQSLLHGD